MKYAIFAVLACAVVTGCTSDDKKSSSVSPAAIMADSKLTPSEKAEKLALAAEQLTSGTSFMYADEVASTALTVDPNNKRAQLIKALVGPAMTLKGLGARIKPVMTRNEYSQTQYNKFLAGLERASNGALKTFLMDGSANIKTEKDVQNYLAEINSAYDRLRLFFKSNKDLQITLNVPDQYQKLTLTRKWEDLVAQQEPCLWTPQEDGSYENQCDMSKALQFKVERRNAADSCRI